MAKEKSLDDVLAEIRKELDVSVGPLNDVSFDVESISTGNIAIDAITGVGGIPRGRLTELYGLPASGKSSCAIQAAVQAQRMGLRVLFLDFEFALDTEYCKALGLDTAADTFLFAQPETLEQGVKIARRLLDTGELGLIIVDSVASMTTERELSAEPGRTFQDKALLLSQALRPLVGELKRKNTACIFLNHLQDVVDLSPMGQRMAGQGIKRTTTPGGKALKYYASLRMEFAVKQSKKGHWLNPVTNENEDINTQSIVLVKVTKNKLAPPFRAAEVRVRYGKGFSQPVSVLGILVAYGLVKKKTAGYFEFPADLDPGIGTIQGEEKILELMESDSDWAELLAIRAQELVDKNMKPVVTDVIEGAEDGLLHSDS